MAIPLSKDYREAIVLLVAMVPSVLLTLSLNKKYDRHLNFNNVSLLMAAGLVLGGGVAEFIKLAIGAGNTWSNENALISIATIWAVSAILNYIYIIRGHASRK